MAYTAISQAQRDQVWELYLRGKSKARIAAQLSLDPHTVAGIITACQRETAGERRASQASKLAAAIARLRRIQQQAWDDHDLDEKRELMQIRYQSQRSQYLRIALDAEREIARLEGLYNALVGVSETSRAPAVVLRIERLEITPAPGATAAALPSSLAVVESDDSDDGDGECEGAG